MPYFVDRDTLTIVVTAPGRPAPSRGVLIDGETLTACVEFLRQGQKLSVTQADALLAGNPAAFLADEPETAEQQRALAALAAADYSPVLPPVGRWEYKVVPVTEMGGLATAKGTAARMEQMLNELAAGGWELVTTSERDARWMAGETVLLTVRRFVVTESMFEARMRAEERIRRAVRDEVAEVPGPAAAVVIQPHS